MGIKSTVEYEFPRWPNFIRQKVAPRPRQDGVNFDGPYLDVGELTVEQIDALIQNFREHCAKRATKIGEGEA